MSSENGDSRGGWMEKRPANDRRIGTIADRDDHVLRRKAAMATGEFSESAGVVQCKQI